MSSENRDGAFSAGIKLKWASKVMPFVPYLVTFITMWLVYLYLFSKGLKDDEPAICLCMRTILLILILYGAYQSYVEKLTMEQLIMLCILGGLVMRMGYTFYTPFYMRPHDFGATSLDDTGHGAYIFSLYEYGELPDSYVGQFYHPPLFHFLASVFMRFFEKLHPDADLNAVYGASQLVSCFASCSVLFLVRSLCRELKCKQEMTCIVMLIVAFCPNFYLLAGRVNNDSMAVALIVFSFLMLVKWYHSRKFSHLIAMAVGIGLGMMTKLNAAIVAFVAGPVMLYVLWQAFREKKWKGLLGQYCAFIAVCAPLGLWYSVRNYTKFKMPFGYVLNLEADGIIDWLYRGDLPFSKRFLSFPWDEFTSSLYCDTTKDYNLPMNIVRTSLFGEFGFSEMDGIAWRLTYINLLLIVLSVVAMIAVVWKGKKLDPMLRYGCAMLWFAIMVSYVVFNIKYPDSCTMDFRYIVPTVVCGAIYLGAFWQMSQEYLEKRDDTKKNPDDVKKRGGVKYYAANVMHWIIPIFCSLYALLSAYMYSGLS